MGLLIQVGPDGQRCTHSSDRDMLLSDSLTNQTRVCTPCNRAAVPLQQASRSMNSPLEDLHQEAGALMGEVAGAAVPRHFGDPGAEYKAATEGVAVIDPGPSTRLGVTGRQPGEMILGVITNSIPGPLEMRTPEVLAGQAAYAAVLTPKGRMITDLWVGWMGSDPEQGLLLEAPPAGAEGLMAHLQKFIPPRLARVEDRSEALAAIRVAGPGAPELLERVALGLRVEREELEAMTEGDVLAVGSHPVAGVRVRRLGDLATPAWELLADRPTVRGLWTGLRSAGASAVGRAVHETLRIEAGRPAYGQDLGEDTIPAEAGLVDRAIDHGKGCYTGQEVIVRIRDRGHVNRHLRGFLFEEGPAIPPGTELFEQGGDRAVGTVTSEAISPRAGGAIGLGYVRRQIEVPATLRAGGPDGPPVEIRELSRADWAF